MSTRDAVIEALRAGRPVLVADDESRENEVDVILSAALASAEWIGWTVRHTSGYLCAPMPRDRAERLLLPPMVQHSEDPRATAYTITADAATGITTGISAADRARTLRVLADPATEPHDLIRPGHIVPLRAVPGGVRERGGHTEAAVDLMRIAGLAPVGVIAELVRDDGDMLRLHEARVLGEELNLPVITVADIGAWITDLDHNTKDAA